MATDKDKAQTADGASDIVAANAGDVTKGLEAQGVSTDGVAEAMRDAQAIQQQNADNAQAAREYTTPDATYVRGADGNVNVAAPADAPLISTYEDALEAGYMGVAAGHANTEKLSVAAVTERDRKLGLPGTGTKGATVNGEDAPTPSKR